MLTRCSHAPCSAAATCDVCIVLCVQLLDSELIGPWDEEERKAFMEVFLQVRLLAAPCVI